MVIINGERRSGKTDGLIFTASITNSQIICPDEPMAKNIARRAAEMGITIKLPMSADKYRMLKCTRSGNDKVPLLIDEAALGTYDGTSIIDRALREYFEVPVIAITMSVPQTLKSFERE